MCLDMWVFQTSEDNIKGLTDNIDMKKLVQVWYLRNHHILHGCLENLYIEKGRKYKKFNCEYVKVTIEDINKLEQVLKEGELPITNDCYMKFGCFSKGYELCSVRYNRDLQFIRKARNILKDDNCLIYSWFW